MDVEFIRTGDRSYRARACRSDSTVVEMSGSTKKTGLPHDLVHLVVESELGMREGFWGRVARGGEFKGMLVTRTKPYKQPRPENRTLAKGYAPWDENLVNGVGRLHAEASNAGWEPGSPFPRVSVIPSALREQGMRVVVQLCVRLREAHDDWRGVPVGGSLFRVWVDQRKRDGATVRADRR